MFIYKITFVFKGSIFNAVSKNIYMYLQATTNTALVYITELSVLSPQTLLAQTKKD